MAPATEAEVRALVAAVARRPAGNGLRITPDNRGGGWAPIATLLDEGGSFAVDVAGDVLALDCDRPGALDALDAIVAELELHGHDPVVVASGTTGHRHLFVRILDPVLRARLARQARAAGIDVRDRAPIRPPGVVHRSGTPPALVRPGSWAAAVAALRRPGPGRRLPSSLWELIARGDQAGRYRRPDGSVDDSSVVMAIANRAVNHGVPAERIWRLLCDPRHAGGRSVQRRLARSQASARQFFERTWQRACEHPGAWRALPVTGRADAYAALERLTLAAERVRFTGRTANSDTAVYRAVFRLAWRHGGIVVPLSVRALAEASGRSVPTVRAALGRFRSWRLLELVRPSRAELAATYRLLDPARARGSCTGSLPSPGGRGTVQEALEADTSWLDPAHDAFAPTALGAGGFRVLDVLGRLGEPTPAELTAATGMHRVTVRRHLHRLLRAGLVERLDDGRLRMVTPEATGRQRLEAVARRSGTAGRAGVRRVCHRNERERYRAFLIQRAARAAAAGTALRPRGHPRLPWPGAGRRGETHRPAPTLAPVT